MPPNPSAARLFPVSARRCVWGMLASFAAINCVGVVLLHVLPVFDIAILQAALLVTVCIAFVLGCRRKGYRTHAHSFEAFAQFILFIVLGSLYSYLGTAAGAAFPYQDGWLLAADRFIGYDWAGYMGWADRHPFLAEFLAYAYISIAFQTFLALAVLTVSGQAVRFYQVLLALLLSSFVTVIISALIPAMSVIGYLHVDMRQFPNVLADPGFIHLNDLNNLRGGKYHSFSLAHLHGLITFPSFHAATAVILIWAFWRTKYLRWPMLALNLIVLLATPLVGVHYVTDVLAGIIIPVALIALIVRVTGEDEVKSGA